MSKEAKTFGLYLGVASVLFNALYYALGYTSIGENDPVQSVVGIVLLLVFFILAALGQKKRQGGYLSYGEGFKTMLGAGVISSLIGVAYMAVMILVLEPDYQQDILNQTYENMIQQNPDMTEEQLEIGMTMTEKFTSPMWMLLFMVFFGILFAAIFAAIIAIFVRKNKPIFDSVDSDSVQ